MCRQGAPASLPSFTTFHTLQQGELSSRFEQTGCDPLSCTPPGFALELLPGKAVQTNPHHTEMVERELSAHHSVRTELREMLFLHRSGCSSPCRIPPPNQAHK